ncbi:MAG: hypothetical protein IPK19_39300 [Chloroflexi bacterium]|nr:hypothetical protein [Chloroflexota bacterium]
MLEIAWVHLAKSGVEKRQPWITELQSTHDINRPYVKAGKNKDDVIIEIVHKIYELVEKQRHL